MSTVMQQTAATPSSLTPSHAAKMPAAKATAPASGDWVVSIIAGKVMTARVT